MPIIVIALLLVSCTSENDKLLNQFETKVEQYENMATNYSQYNAQQMDSAYNEIDGIMNQLLEAELTEADMSRATQLSIRLQVAIAGIQEQRQQDIEIDLNEMAKLDKIETIKSYSQIIDNGLKEKNLKIRSKYLWLKEYFNKVLPTDGKTYNMFAYNILGDPQKADGENK